jgi:hypothetical protein
MTKFRGHAPDPGAESKLESLRQELAELNETLAQLEKEVRKTPRARAPRISPKPAPQAIAAKIAATATPAPGAVAKPIISESIPPSPAVPAAEVRTDDLSQPKSFGSLPPFSLFNDASLPPDELRKRLTKALPYAIQVLHTSGVRPEIWREWRAFEKAIRARLAAGAGTAPQSQTEAP